jgi:hypothetical protein
MRIVVDADTDEGRVDQNSVVGYVIISVALTEDDGLDVSRYFHVQNSTPENNQIVTDFLKQADAKLSELFPAEEVPEAKLWIPE